MSTQPDLFDADWEKASQSIILAMPGEFTADDLHDRGLLEPSHRNKIGTLFRSLARQNLIRCVGYQDSTRKERKGGLQRKWEVVR